MSFIVKTEVKADNAASFVALSILSRLKEGKRVLFFVPGGSAVSVAVKVSEIVKKYPHQNLTVTLTDERYGPVDHPDSNWRELLEKGFSLPEAKLMPVLAGEDRDTTVKKFDKMIHKGIEMAEYKIGLFGIGADGHTAGILPKSMAIKSRGLACGYDTPKFSRITITPKAVEKLDEAVVWAQGEEKWGVLKNMKKNIDITKQPAQVLKKVPLLTIFSDM